MTSRIVRKILWVGIALLIILIVIVLAGFLIPSLPDTIRKAFLNIHSMFYWLIPLIMLLFFSPTILESSRKPDIDILFEPRGDGDLRIVIINRGDVPFSFNRVQFYAGRTRIAVPEDGKTRQLWFQKAGEVSDYEMRGDAACAVARGIPLIFWTHKKDIDTWLSYISEKAPNKSIHCRLFFKGTNMKAESKRGLPSDFVGSCKKHIATRSSTANV